MEWIQAEGAGGTGEKGGVGSTGGGGARKVACHGKHSSQGVSRKVIGFVGASEVGRGIGNH